MRVWPRRKQCDQQQDQQYTKDDTEWIVVRDGAAPVAIASTGQQKHNQNNQKDIKHIVPLSRMTSTTPTQSEQPKGHPVLLPRVSHQSKNSEHMHSTNKSNIISFGFTSHFRRA
jgi:hypothetical protein